MKIGINEVQIVFIGTFSRIRSTEWSIGRKSFIIIRLSAPDLHLNLATNSPSLNVFLITIIIAPSRLSPQWLCGNSCTWAHDVRLYIARSTNEPKSAQQAKQGA